MKSMKLAHGLPLPAKVTDYKVLIVKNSVTYKPGEILCKAEVEDLCRNSAWDITVIAYKEDSK